jgi:signal transduction histidine kinase
MHDFPKQVLLIEDNPGDADLIRLRLIESRTQLDVSCVNRLSEGLASIESTPPSVVLLDLNLPDSQGSETFRKVLEKAPGVPVVILSGKEDEALAMKAIHQGVQDYLIKADLTSRTLERSLRYAVERQSVLRSLDMSRKQQIEFKNQFLSHVSHELRTPLTCIHQYASLLFDGLSGPVSPEQRDHLQTILKSVNQLHAMIRDLLEATRAESGKLRIEPRCLALVELARQAIAMIRPMAVEKRITVQLEADSHIPLVHADPDRVLEVLINLLDNAVKFTPPQGSVTINLSQQKTDPEFTYVTVTDTGRGISPEALPLIFERLYQDPDSVDGNRSGLGLGLYIARELINLHGGRIWAVSQPSQGATFTFNLPVYSLSKLLFPLITHEPQLRESIVLVRVDLKPLASPVRGNWKEVCHDCLNLLRHCVYVDKDLVLPAMATNGPEDTFYVVASTDMERVNIMISRIVAQIGALTHLKATGTIRATARPVEFSAEMQGKSLKQQVEQVAESVTELVLTDLRTMNGFNTKETSANAD